MDLNWLWLIIPSIYLTISTILLCFPCWKKHRYRNQDLNALVDQNENRGQVQVMCIGHRGGGFEGPENTLQLFEKTDRISHMFQLDLQETADFQLVVHHDATLARTTGNSSNVNELTYEQLPRFKKQLIPFGSITGVPLQTAQNRIILLDELFEKFPRKLMNIELKSPTQTAIKQYARLVRKHNRQNYTIWGAVSDEARERLMEEIPDSMTFYSAWQTLKIFLLTITGLLPFWCIRPGVLDIPLVTEGMIKMADNMANSCGRKVAVCLIISLLRFFNLMSRLFIPHLRKRGILTFYWIINEEEGWERAVAMGSRGIMTDRPSDLAVFLKRKGMYFRGQCMDGEGKEMDRSAEKEKIIKEK